MPSGNGHRPPMVAPYSSWWWALGATALVWLPMLVWFLAFRPGIMTPDSLVTWEQATLGGWVDWHPPVNTAVMWVSAELFGSPGPVTLVQSLLLAASVVAVARASLRAGANRWAVIAVTAVLALSPMVGAFSVSIWKDIPYTACLLFIGARIVDLARARAAGDPVVARQAVVSVCLWGLLASAVRQNGIFFLGVLLIALLILFRDLRRWTACGLLLVVASVAWLKLVVYPVADIRADPKRQVLAPFLHDIAAVADRAPEAFDRGDLSVMSGLGPSLEQWRTDYRAFGCESALWEWLPRYELEQLSGHERQFMSIWLRATLEHPLLVLGNRACVSALAWRPDPVGTLYSVSRGIDENRLGLRTIPASDGLHSVALDVLEATDDGGVQWILWRAPPWIYLAYAVFALKALRRRRWLDMLPVLPLLVLQVTVAPLNTTPDARFMFSGLMLAVLLLPLGFTVWDPDDLPPAASVSADPRGWEAEGGDTTRTRPAGAEPSPTTAGAGGAPG